MFYDANELSTVCSYVTIEETEYGSLTKDGNYSGAIGLVQRRQVDFGADLFIVHEKRGRVVDFTDAFFEGMYHVVLRRTVRKHNAFALMRPLKLGAGMLLLVAVMVTGVFSFVITRYNWIHARFLAERQSHQYLPGFFKLYNALWYILGTVFQQGIVFYIQRNSCKKKINRFFEPTARN